MASITPLFGLKLFRESAQVPKLDQFLHYILKGAHLTIIQAIYFNFLKYDMLLIFLPIETINIARNLPMET